MFDAIEELKLRVYLMGPHHTVSKEYLFFLFLTKLKIMGKIDTEDYHRAYGVYSGYSKCCIDNFIDLIKRGKAPAAHMRYIYGKDAAGIHYVRCSKCRTISYPAAQAVA